MSLHLPHYLHLSLSLLISHTHSSLSSLALFIPHTHSSLSSLALSIPHTHSSLSSLSLFIPHTHSSLSSLALFSEVRQISLMSWSDKLKHSSQHQRSTDLIHHKKQKNIYHYASPKRKIIYVSMSLYAHPPQKKQNNMYHYVSPKRLFYRYALLLTYLLLLLLFVQPI